MDLKKRYDYDDLSNFLPDNVMVCTEQFYRKKYKNLPDYLYKVLEVKAKNWYSEKDEKEAIEEAKQKIKDYNNKLLKELDERFNHVDDENNELQFEMESFCLKNKKDAKKNPF